MNSSFPLGMMNEDGCEMNLQEKRTPLGNKLDEEITLRGITLWGRDVLLMILTITPLGIPLISSVGGFNDELRWGWITCCWRC